MKELTVKKIDLSVVETQDIPKVFQMHQIEYSPVDSVNWPLTFPYQPLVSFAIAHNGNSILLHFRVQEENTKATRTTDGADIWNDSCAEFFIKFKSDAPYYNLETNCIGACLMAMGNGRNDRKILPQNTVSKIKRWSSLGNQPVNDEGKLCKWDLCIEIPKETFVFSDINSFSGISAYGNFYKCGDELAVPHFLSWNPIKSDSPDFHLPEFFGKINFE